MFFNKEVKKIISNVNLKFCVGIILCIVICCFILEEFVLFIYCFMCVYFVVVFIGGLLWSYLRSYVVIVGNVVCLECYDKKFL